jgi:hypothetical protein
MCTILTERSFYQHSTLVTALTKEAKLKQSTDSKDKKKIKLTNNIINFKDRKNKK